MLPHAHGDEAGPFAQDCKIISEMSPRPTLCELVANELGRATEEAENLAVATAKLRANPRGNRTRDGKLDWRATVRGGQVLDRSPPRPAGSFVNHARRSRPCASGRRRGVSGSCTRTITWSDVHSRGGATASRRSPDAKVPLCEQKPDTLPGSQRSWLAATRGSRTRKTNGGDARKPGLEV